MQINLPQAGGEASVDKIKPINVSIDASARYAINSAEVNYTGIGGLSSALKKSAAGQADPVIVINADAKTPHQAVINVMEAARQAGYSRITFATQNEAN